MTDDWPACTAAAADPEGAFTVAAQPRRRSACSHSAKEVLFAAPGEEVDRAGCEAAAANPEGVFTAAADEASLVAGAGEPGPAAAAGPEGAFTAAIAAGGGTA